MAQAGYWVLLGLLKCLISNRTQGGRRHGPAEHLNSGALQGGQGRVKIWSITSQLSLSKAGEKVP